MPKAAPKAIRTRTRTLTPKSKPKPKTLLALPPSEQSLPMPDIEAVKDLAKRQIAVLRLGVSQEEGAMHLKSPEGQIFVPPTWPVDNETVQTVFLAWYFHRLTPEERYQTADEAYRCLVPGGELKIVSPYWSSRRAISDPLAVWPPLCEDSFYVYSRAFRQFDGLTNLVPLICDFQSLGPNGELIIPSGHVADPLVKDKNDEYRSIASRHWLNSVWEMHVTLKKAS